MASRATSIRRVGALAIGAMTLGACNWGLTFTPSAPLPGSSVGVTNADTWTCPIEEGDGGPVPMEVALYLFSGQEDLTGGPPEPLATVMTDAATGAFDATLTAPERPGQHFVAASCGGEVGGPGVPELQAAAPVDDDGTILDLLTVAQAPLTVAVDKSEVAPGTTVTATFNRCQAENDFGLLEEIGGGEGGELPPELEGLDVDFPDLVVTVDGTVVETIEGTERYPVGTVDVPIELDAVGSHEIKGVCTYQTLRWDEAFLADLFAGGGVAAAAAAPAAVDYPVSPEGAPFTFDEATVQAATTVRVVAPAAPGPGVGAGGAVPVVAQPAFTG
jgi:hypothetical protein